MEGFVEKNFFSLAGFAEFRSAPVWGPIPKDPVSIHLRLGEDKTWRPNYQTSNIANYNNPGLLGATMEGFQNSFTVGQR
jgi:hypothetical protein